MASKPRQLVQGTAETLRQRIFDHAPGARIGSLKEIAEELDVGIVTIQQVARILEHEGLLEVRRGPGGGYFGRRPDIETLESALSAYMRSHPSSWEDALDLTSLLFIELCAAAAHSNHESDEFAALQKLQAQIADCDPEEALARLEEAFQNTLFRIVDRPLFELMTRVTLHFSARSPNEVAAGLIPASLWQEGRLRIIAAIIAGDAALARFEANRSNRELIMKSLSRWPT